MKRWFWLIVALQLLFLVAEVATKEMAIRTARTVTLKTAPIDPRSLFAGNYMWLTYDISSMTPQKAGLTPSEFRKLPYSGLVYAKLAIGKPWAKLIRITTHKPDKLEPGVIYLRGRVRENYHDMMTVDYGIDRYYIPENKADEVARLQRWGPKHPIITVEVAVTDSGRGMIKRVLVDGRPLGF
jgi:uncharacterized membrane-anchored protein